MNIAYRFTRSLLAMMVMALVLIMDMGISSNVLYHCGGNPLYVKAICGLLCHAKSVLQELDNLKEAFSPDLKLSM